MKRFKNNKGYTETELIMVFSLIALLGILCFTLIQAGSGAYERLAKNHTGKSYARVALSYIENRVRQGDDGGSIMIVDNPYTQNQKALVISGITGIDDESLWIMQIDNKLVEYYVAEGTEIDQSGYFEIGEIESFRVELIGSTLSLEVGYATASDVETQARIITLRSGGAP